MKQLIVDLKQAQRSYSAEAVMTILGINKEGLRRLEEGGKLKLASRDGSIPGYPAEQVEALAYPNRGTRP